MVDAGRLTLRTFGGLDAHWEAGPSIPFPTRKSKALLLYLAMAAGEPQPRGKLATLLWDRSAEEFEAFVQDLETVVDTVGLERFTLLGISQGCAVSIAYAVRHPERVTHLILHGGYARGVYRRGGPEEIERYEALLTLTKSGWGQENPAFRDVFTTLFIPEATPEQRQSFSDLERISTSPENAVRLQRAFAEIDVASLLPEVRAPTLVLHARRESRIPFSAGRELASGIPGARFVPLESANHLILEHEPASARWLAEIKSFLAGEVGARGTPRASGSPGT